MKTKTNKTEAQVATVSWTFDEEFGHMFRLREKQYNEAKGKFAKEAIENPAYAIKWADKVMESQYVYECWVFAQKHLARVGTGEGMCFATKQEAIAACVEMITDELMTSIGGGQSTCLLARADHLARQNGYKSGLREIKGLLKSTQIDA